MSKWYPWLKYLTVSIACQNIRIKLGNCSCEKRFSIDYRIHKIKNYMHYIELNKREGKDKRNLIKKLYQIQYIIIYYITYSLFKYCTFIFNGDLVPNEIWQFVL